MLCELTANLERSFRSSDLLGRIGGDEFAVLMCDITSMENALVKAGQICSLYTKGAAKEGLKISCSIGMVFCESDDGAAFDDLYQKADSALYKAKEKAKMFLSYLMKICCENSRNIQEKCKSSFSS